MYKYAHNNSAVLKVIREGAKEQTRIQITYIDAKDRPSIRIIEPYEIKAGSLYGHCVTKNAIRAFKLDRIQSAVLDLETFIPRFPILIE